MTYDLKKKMYVQQQPPKDAPLAVTIQVDSEEYLRHTPKLPLIINKGHCKWNGTKWIHDLTKPLPMITMAADTGAQVDTVGPQHLAKLGLDEEGLLRSSVGLYCADDTKAHYLGGVPGQNYGNIRGNEAKQDGAYHGGRDKGG